MKTLIYLLKSTFRFNIWKYLTIVSGFIIPILTLGKDFGKDLKESLIYGICGLAIIFLLVFMFYFIKYTITHLHNKFIDSIWGDAIKYLKDAYADIHALERTTNATQRDYLQALEKICNVLKRIFDKKTGLDCSVSIKLAVSIDDLGPVDPLQSFQFKNICRDSEHYERNNEKYNSVVHTLLKNTPYIECINNLGKANNKYAYINNNIPASQGYQNSSTEAYRHGLPYKSELVYPIIPIKRISSKNNYADFLGFICIDCPEVNQFDAEKYDVPLIEGVVDSIYNSIYFLKYNEKTILQ